MSCRHAMIWYDLYIYANLCSLCIGNKDTWSLQYTPLRQICHSLGTLWGHFGSKDGTTTYKTPTYEIYVQTHHDVMHLYLSVLVVMSRHHVYSHAPQWQCQRVRPVAALPIAHTLPWTLSPSAAAPNRCGSTGNEDSLHTRPDPTPGLADVRSVYCEKHVEIPLRLRHVPGVLGVPPIPKLFQTFHVKNASFSNLQIFTSGWRCRAVRELLETLWNYGTTVSKISVEDPGSNTKTMEAKWGKHAKNMPRTSSSR